MVKMLIQQTSLKNIFNELARFKGKGDLQMISLKVEEKQLVFHSTDGEVVFIANVPVKEGETVNAEVIEKGELMLPPKFEEVIRKLPAGMIEVAKQENGQIELRKGKTNVKVNGISTELPAIPAEKKGEALSLTTEVLASLVNSTSFAAADNDARPILKAIHMSSGEESFRVVSTDSHRLSMRVINKDLGLPALSIPAKRLQEVVNILPEKASLQLIPLGSYVLIRTAQRDIYIRQLEGTYPDISRLTTPNGKVKINVNRKQIIESIDRAMTFAKEGQHRGISLEVGEGILKIYSSSDSTGNIEEEIGAELEGDKLSFTVNAKFTLDALKAFNTEKVLFQIEASEKPVFIFSDEDPSLTQLVLPIRTA